ncbi:Chorismate--pyruvate lyase [hydrothermal vent metagenome]|uniref:Chorismate--pyruvate lyase n=1 Tax=hydrothermal vent metagenome TaxID=652676 RepID=A0A3B0WN45_9ZZZZ
MNPKQRWYLRHQLFNQSIPAPLLSWLFDPSSLTARLIALHGSDFSVQVISQQWQKLDPEEAAAMALNGVHSALVRQVLLCAGETPLVYARTVIPATTIQGAQRRYANMGNRPLGAMLFADRTMRREVVQVAKLPSKHVANHYAKIDAAVWGRRSVFRVTNKPILVSEYFLPELLG